MAGSDMETKPPMLCYEKDDADPAVVYTRDTADTGGSLSGSGRRAAPDCNGGTK
jgi:hypothetical protein